MQQQRQMINGPLEKGGRSWTDLQNKQVLIIGTL
jgi:hypothetical protein